MPDKKIAASHSAVGGCAYGVKLHVTLRLGSTAVTTSRSGRAGQRRKNCSVWFFLVTVVSGLWSVDCTAYEPPRYEIDARIDIQTHTIAAKQKVTFTNATDKPTDSLYFHIYPHRRYTKKEKNFILRYAAYFKVNPFPEGFQSGDFIVNAISSQGKNLTFAIEGEDDTILKVDLEKQISPGESITVIFDYKVVIPHAYGRFGWHKTIVSLLRWYPMLSVFDSDGWHNYPFYPYHQPYFSEAANYTVNLTVPREQEVIHSGILKTESQNNDGTKTLSIESELPLRDFGMTLSPEYRKESVDYNGIKINSYYLGNDTFYAHKALESAKDLMEFYTKKCAPYPYTEFNIAPAYLGYGGTQSSNLILIDTRVYRLPKFLIRYFDFLIAHETGHQWFYNIVGSDEFKEMVIDEGMNSYFILQYLEDKYGDDAKVMVLPRYCDWLIPNFSFTRAQLDRYSFVAKHGLDSPVLGELSSFQEPSSIFSITYGKGSKIWDMLEYVIGQDAFQRVRQRYFSEYKFKNISVADIRKLAQEEAHTDLGWFFDEWLNHAKKCDYAIKDVRDGKILLENRGSHDMAMPLELEVEFEDGKKRMYQWDGRGKEKEIVVDASARIRAVRLDPRKRVLDLDRANNNWKRAVAIKPIPLYSPLYEIPVFLRDDAYSVVLGPQIGGSELGLKSSLQKPQDSIAYVSNTYNFNEERVKNTVGFEQRHLGGKLLKWGVEAFDYHDGEGDDDQSGFKVYLRKELWPVSYGLLDENDHVTMYLLRDRDAKSALSSGGLEDIRNLYYRKADEAIVGINLKLGRYGPYPDPLTGWKFISTLENAGHFLGGDTSFWRLSPELTRYFNFNPQQIIAARVKFGFGYPSDKGLFQLGGEKGLRGYGYKTINGSQAALLNIECRQDIIDNLDIRVLDNMISLEKIQGVGFFDIGKSWFASFEGRSFKKDIGVGLRLHFTVGSFLERFILRLDAAQAINQPKSKRHYWVGFSQAF